MKKLLSCIVIYGIVGSSAIYAKESVIKSDRDKISYSLAQQIGRNLRDDDVDINIDVFVNSLSDAYSGKQSKLSPHEIQENMMKFQQIMIEKGKLKAEATGAKNKKEGAIFLESNKNKADVKVTKSGIQYKVLKSGTGKSPKSTDTVETHYIGKLIDGTVFDSSYKRNQPATFPVSGVIKGWTEALQMMKVGDKWELVIPPELGYGKRGSGSAIGPDATLIFEVELLAIK